MVKPNERITRYVDAVLTVPRGSLYSMSPPCLAFDRFLLGPALYFAPAQPGHPDGRSSVVFAGFCIKLICDHLGLGCKTGLPVVKRVPTTRRPVDQFEFKDVFMKGRVVPFLQAVRLSPVSTSVEACVEELAGIIKAGLGPLDTHFHTVADGMTAWLQCWKLVNHQ